MEKKNSGLVATTVISILLVIGLGGYIAYDKLLANNKMEEKECQKCEVCPVCSNEQITTRTYRFFGYTIDSEPDMYTTLKLHSNNKYEFVANNCEDVSKYTGEYTENNNEIILKGDTEIKFTKKDNGNSLEFDVSILCMDSKGTFRLENNLFD